MHGSNRSTISVPGKNVNLRLTDTDHLSFLAVGVPGFNPFQDYQDYDLRTHHTNMDKPSM